MKAHCYEEEVCPNCMRTACNSRYFVRAAAVRSESKKVWDLECRVTVLFKAPKAGCIEKFTVSLHGKTSFFESKLLRDLWLMRADDFFEVWLED